MPIIRRAQIFTFKEVIVTDFPGLITDSVGTYTLDDPSTNPNGTGDFLGIIKSVALLGEVEIHTVDTRNLSIAQFNNLTQQEFDNYVRNTTIGYTRETVGWVEMGRTNASFYYETCSGGKRPVSEHYYNLEDFAFDDKRVYGEGPNILSSNATAIGAPNTPLTPIGNFDPNWYTNIGPIGPRFEPLTLPAYMYGVIFNEGKITNSDGEIREVRGFYTREPSTWQPTKNGNRPIRKNILFANKSEHFDNKFATEISPGKWGAVRGTIQQAVIPPTIGGRVTGQPVNSVPISMNFDVSKGECLQIVSATPSGGTTTTVTTGGPTPPVMVGGGLTTTPVTGGPTPPPTIITEEDVTVIYRRPTSATNIQKDLSSGSYNTDLKVFRDFTVSPCINFIHDFPISLKQKLNIASNTSIDLAELNDTYLDGNTANPLLELGFGTDAARLKWQMGEAIAGRIPFETSNVPDIGDTLTIPRGTIRKEINPDNGCLELTYIGTPMLDYVGPKIVTPADIDYERGDRPGYDEMEELDIFVTGGRLGGGDILNTKQWYKDMFAGGLKGQGRGQFGAGGSMSRQGAEQVYGIIATESDLLYPYYFHASDQLWTNGVGQTKSIRLSNRGMSRLIITDYSPRGNANFRNVGLIDALPIILNPDEYVDVLIDYVPVKQGLQSWKGKDDPFTALLSNEYPLNYIKMEFEVWTRVSKLGYVRIQDIVDKAGVGPYQFKKGGGEAGLDRELTRKAEPWEIKKRNKLYSILAVDVVKQD